jgi:uncharacterized protein
MIQPLLPRPVRPLGAGLGFRRDLIKTFDGQDLSAIDFFEIAPENWLTLGGRYADQLRRYTERFPFVCHGLSLSLGGAHPLNLSLLRNIKHFMRDHGMTLYTEHLSWCADEGQLYDLLPVPCTQDALKWVSARIQQAQDILGQAIAIENASYYVAPPGAEMAESDFIRELVYDSGCYLHLDVNNVYVNSQNFGFDPLAYLAELPLDRVCYLHVAGHFTEEDGLIIDTHGAPVKDPVWDLLEQTYARIPEGGLTPTCLERDFNFPPLPQLLSEVARVRCYQQAAHRPSASVHCQ